MSSTNQKKFLIIKLSALGDVVHALPTARTLRQEHPDAFIAWVIEERYQVLLQNNPDINEVIPIRTKVWRKNLNADEVIGQILADQNFKNSVNPFKSA